MTRQIPLALILLLLAPAIHSAPYGYSRISVERVWNVTSDAPFDFTGALAVNDSNQRVVSVSTDPEMEVASDENGSLILHYSGNGSVVLRASAIVDVDYGHAVPSDPALPGRPLNSTNLTAADSDISIEARDLAHMDSTLLTIRDLVNFVHGYVMYDISYWSKFKSAAEVFHEKRGVCVEYTHLLISMARSLGLDTRYVSGYVDSGGWQPHAWAEIYVPGYGWLPADATFGQAGVLDSSHVAIRISDDQTASYDLILSQDENIDVEARDTLIEKFSGEDAKGVSLVLALDAQTYVAKVDIINTNPAYVFGTYDLSIPDGYGGDRSSVMLLRPKETVTLYHGLNHSLFGDGYLYSIPVYASFNDARDDETLSLERYVDVPGGTSDAAGCLSGAVLIIFAAIALRML